MAADLARRHHRSGGGITLIEVPDTRPGGPNRQERAHRVGAPESLTEAIEESGMVQVHTCVSVHCDQCGTSLGGPGSQTHYPTEDAALDAAAAEGWRVGPGGRLWCSACGPVLTCEAEGHEFTEWTPAPLDRDYRYCPRYCLHESRPAGQPISGLRGQGELGACDERLGQRGESR